MKPTLWQPSTALSTKEEQVLKRMKKAKLFVFLRKQRHEIFDEAFQNELATLSQDSKRGHPPIAPAQLALATLLQAYMGVSDDEVIEATVMDRRWQLVLDCLDSEQAPIRLGTLVGFRGRLIEAQMDRRLIERTIELGEHSGAFGSRALRAALDSSPLWGAGRVEDTYNVVGHALRKVMSVIAAQREWELAEVAQEAGAELVCGSSLKANLDRDWDQTTQKEEALSLVLTTLTQVEDGQMRHGRKSRSVRVDGYKRHVLHDMDSGMVRAVGVTAANAPEASVTEAISADWERQIICCPASLEMPFTPGGVVHFPKKSCVQCPLQAQCTTSPKGRSVSIHPDEALLVELRQRQLTPAGRAQLRERVAVEHTLAHIGHWQGERARYRGLRKNLFDLRRCAVIHHLHVLARSEPFLQAA